MKQKVAETAEKWVKDFDVRTPSIDAAAGTLSGGNQQKVIVAREFSRETKLADCLHSRPVGLMLALLSIFMDVSLKNGMRVTRFW
jgi:ABC-type phosphonate transport system ATPase subunit